MRTLVVSALLIATPWSLAPAHPAQGAAELAAGATVTYRFENPAFLVTEIEMRVDAAGEGTLRFTRKGLANPVERQFRVQSETFGIVEELLDRIDFFGPPVEYQSEKERPSLGTVTLSATRGGRERTVRFNYSENRDAVQLAQVLAGLANREMRLFDLEVATRYAPLETPSLIQGLEDDLRLGRISEPAALLPLLRSIAGDVTLPLISRNRAGKLVERIEKIKKPGAR